MMGSEGLKKASQVAILNANYIAHKLKDSFPILYKGKNGNVAHECIIDIRRIKKDFPSFKDTLNTIPALYNYEIDKIKELIKSTNSDGISLHIDSSESIKLVKKLKKEENFVIAWTVNDSRFMRKLTKWQADGIITDYPQKLLKILNKK